MTAIFMGAQNKPRVRGSKSFFGVAKDTDGKKIFKKNINYVLTRSPHMRTFTTDSIQMVAGTNKKKRLTSKRRINKKETVNKETAMKKAVAILATTLAAAAAMAQTNTVLSKNAVGYVRIDVPTNKLALIANPFVQVGTSVESATVQALFGDVGSPLPSGVQVLVWNPSGQKYNVELFDSIDGWSPGTNIISRGQGIFFKVPSSYTSSTYSVYLLGEVPTAIKTNRLTAGFNAVGYGFPTTVQLTNSAINLLAAGGDQVSTWNVATQSYQINLFDAIDGWSTPSQVFTPGQGIFYKRLGSATNWVEAKPYTWP